MKSGGVIVQVMRVVIFHASSHECDLARLLSARLNGSADGTRAISTPLVASPKYRSLRPLLRPVRKIWSRARGLVPLSLAPLSYVTAFLRCGYRRMRAHGMVKKSAADVIVLFEDNIGNFTRFIGAAAARMNVPYVVMPTTIPNPREAAGFFRSSKAHAASGWLARLIARRWPQWAYDFDGHRMLRLSPADIIAMRALGVDNAKPWVLNSGQASAVCAESTANRRIDERLGVEARQIATIGNLVDDVLFDASRDRETAGGIGNRARSRSRPYAARGGFPAGSVRCTFDAGVRIRIIRAARGRLVAGPCPAGALRQRRAARPSAT